MQFVDCGNLYKGICCFYIPQVVAFFEVWGQNFLLQKKRVRGYTRTHMAHVPLISRYECLFVVPFKASVIGCPESGITEKVSLSGRRLSSALNMPSIFRGVTSNTLTIIVCSY